MTDSPWLRPAALPQPAPPAPKPCGHNDSDSIIRAQAIVTFDHLPEHHRAGRPRFVGLLGGPQRLARRRCADCDIPTGYALQRTPEGAAESIGYDGDIVAAAINALLGQVDVDVFTLVVDQEGFRDRIVLPRHHLPTFVVTGGQ